MTEPRLHLPLSSAPSLVQRMCSIHQDLRPATSGCEIRPGVWLCAQCWKARYGAISGRVHRNGGAPARAPGAGQRGRALGGLIAGIAVGLLIGAAVGIPVSKLKHPMAARDPTGMRPRPSAMPPGIQTRRCTARCPPAYCRTWPVPRRGCSLARSRRAWAPGGRQTQSARRTMSFQRSWPGSRRSPRSRCSRAFLSAPILIAKSASTASNSPVGVWTFV